MGTLLHNCAEVCEPIELLFGMVGGIGLSIHALDGGSCAPKGRAVLGIFRHLHPIGLNGQNEVFSNVFNSYVKS